MSVMAEVVRLPGMLLLCLVLNQGQAGRVRPWDDSTICVSPICTMRAGAMLSAMKRTVDPCQDFYKFACGQFGQRTNSRLSQLGQQQYIVNARLLKILNRPQVKHVEPVSYKVVRDFFQSCMNFRKLKDLGDDPLLNIVHQTFNNFPQDLTARLLRVAKVTQFPLFFTSMGLSPRNNSRYILYIDQPKLKMDRHIYLNNNTSLMRNYCQFLSKILYRVDMAPVNTSLWQRGRAVVNLEVEMARSTLSPIEASNISTRFRLVTVSSLQRLFPELQWREYLQGLFDMYNVNYTVTNDDVVISLAHTYLHDVFRLLRQSPPELVRNYLLWSVVYDLLPYTAGSIRSFWQAHFKEFGELPVPHHVTGRAKYCTIRVKNALPAVVGHMYMDEFNDSDMNELGLQIVKKIHHAFGDMIALSDWLSNATRILALQKLRAMKLEVGIPLESMYETTLDEQYGGVSVTPFSFLKNSMAIDWQFMRLMLQRKTRAREHLPWPSSTTQVNAYYLKLANAIIVPSGLLMTETIDSKLPSYLNYGRFGSLVGHEIAHGFDTTGRQFDINGKQVDWWSDQDIIRYEKKAECFRRQYEQFTIGGRHLNGMLTLNENMADNGGLTAAYKAFTRVFKETWKAHHRLPGVLTWTPQKLFFMAYAQTWCAPKSRLVSSSGLYDDDHSPAKYRVLGAVMNSHDFATAFHCPVGSPMNPVEKCRMW